MKAKHSYLSGHETQDLLLGNVDFLLRALDLDGAQGRVAQVRLFGYLDVGTGGTLQRLDRVTALADHQTDLIIGNLQIFVELLLKSATTTDATEERLC